MPDHLWWNIMKNFLPMEDIFNLRKTGKHIENITRKPYLRTLWNIKKKQREDKFLENRANLVRGWNASRPRVNQKDELVFMNEIGIQSLFRELRENLKLSREHYEMEYDQQKLVNYGLEEVMFTNLMKIHGRGCWAYADKENPGEGMIVVPKCKGDSYFEEATNTWIQVILVEVVSFNWNDGIDNTLFSMEEENLRSSRYLPLDGENRSLVNALDKINMHPLIWNSWEETNSMWPCGFERLWL